MFLINRLTCGLPTISELRFNYDPPIKYIVREKNARNMSFVFVMLLTLADD